MKKTSLTKGLYESPECWGIDILHSEFICVSGSQETFIVDPDDDVEF